MTVYIRAQGQLFRDRYTNRTQTDGDSGHNTRETFLSLGSNAEYSVNYFLSGEVCEIFPLGLVNPLAVSCKGAGVHKWLFLGCNHMISGMGIGERKPCPPCWINLQLQTR